MNNGQTSHAAEAKRLVHISINNHDDDNLPWGGEPVLHDDVITGMTTSATFGFNSNKPVAMAFITLPVAQGVEKCNFEIEIANKLYPVDLHLVSV